MIADFDELSTKMKTALRARRTHGGRKQDQAEILKKKGLENDQAHRSAPTADVERKETNE